MRNCALVQRAWQPSSYYHLFRSLFIPICDQWWLRTRPDELDRPTRRSSTQCIQFLSQSRYLRQHVHELELNVLNGISCFRRGPASSKATLATICPGDVLAVVDLLPNVRRLTLSGQLELSVSSSSCAWAEPHGPSRWLEQLTLDGAHAHTEVLSLFVRQFKRISKLYIANVADTTLSPGRSDTPLDISGFSQPELNGLETLIINDNIRAHTLTQIFCDFDLSALATLTLRPVSPHGHGSIVHNDDSSMLRTVLLAAKNLTSFSCGMEHVHFLPDIPTVFPSLGHLHIYALACISFPRSRADPFTLVLDVLSRFSATPLAHLRFTMSCWIATPTALHAAVSAWDWHALDQQLRAVLRLKSLRLNGTYNASRTALPEAEVARYEAECMEVLEKAFEDGVSSSTRLKDVVQWSTRVHVWRS